MSAGAYIVLNLPLICVRVFLMKEINTEKLVMGFWAKLPKPFFALAPMADVTDAAFRRIIAKYSRHGEPGGLPEPSEALVHAHLAGGRRAGGPDVFWTEFVSADGLVSRGREALMHDLAYTEGERPIVAQLFTANPDHMREAARIVRELGFDGIDINMGCPDKTIEKQGAGAALIKDFKRAQAVIRAAEEGAGNLPVSVKTRIGYNTNVLEEWLEVLLETKPAAITMHARTRKELSLVPARWEEVARAVKMAKGSGTLIIGNGDVRDLADAREKALATGADGVMLGRAIFGNPWLFDATRTTPPTLAEKFDVMIEHTHLFENLLGGVKSFAIMKKHYKAYAHGFDGAKELRMRLMDAENAGMVERIAREFLRTAPNIA
ncbi:MAG: tRNA-dihydrouridine synthase [Parcubacteria group bacterium GW2011_GWA1_47_8]|nr:MAG: tRNA-dihydrouridine synthase [Parcubacteria group bacterium GW2011_GWA1_47_8]KKW08051.1 MAG: tRNA-dihydrouridine synthase [Parcubacteria group bacterium GW2011_GWA2_49_16]